MSEGIIICMVIGVVALLLVLFFISRKIVRRAEGLQNKVESTGKGNGIVAPTSSSNQKNQNTTLSQPDINLLTDLSNTFPGDRVQNLINEMESTILYGGTIDYFEEAVHKFSAHHRCFRSSNLENAKESFISSLSGFFSFTTDTFNPIQPGNRYKFYGGISEYEIMTKLHSEYEKHDLQYRTLGREVVDSWANLMSVVRSEAPDFDWKS